MLSAPWSWILAAVFAASALYCAWHWFRNDRFDPTGARLVDANHALMGVLMIVMIFRPAGQLGSIIQAAVFGAFGLAQIIVAVRSSQLGYRISMGTHVLMNIAMIWMLLAMPMLMGHDPNPPGGGHGHDHGHSHDHGAHDTVAVLPTPAWAEVVNGVVIGAMVVVAVWWLTQIVLQRHHRLHSACHFGMASGMAIMLGVM